ncbi:MAG: hypothetical protein OXG15_00870 [Gammaproteobacteria bacterium]|nr:hypothetical protein [Gammaproteobacteria bacterium]
MASTEHKRYPVRAIRFLLKVFSWLPLRASRAFAALAGFLAWRLKTRAARTTIQNIEHCYGDLSAAEQQKLARRSLRHTASTVFELPAVWTSSYTRLNRWIKDVHGESILTDGIEKGSVLMLLPHFGNWEVLATYMKRIAKYSCMYSPRRLYELDELINQCRGRFGSEFLPLTRAGFRALLTRIRNGGVIVLLPDQVPVDGQSVISAFLGRPLKTGTLPHALLKRGDLKAVTMVAVRCEGGFEVHIHDVEDDLYSQDAEVSIRALDRAIERIVELDPAQYQWEYKRFRGSAEIYS